MAVIVIGLGSNLEEPARQLARALDHIAAIGGITVRACSSLYDSAPVGPPQPRYVNAAVSVQWDRSPEDLLDALLAIEQRMGRVRRERWGPRVIDLDVLWSSDGSWQSERLCVPHPELSRRAFALAPLLEVVPVLTATFASALAECGGAPKRIGALRVERSGTD